MFTDWVICPLRAAFVEIGLMRKERAWGRLDGMVREVEAGIASLNAHQADQYSDTRLHWQRGRLAWQGPPPAELGGIGRQHTHLFPERTSGIER